MQGFTSRHAVAGIFKGEIIMECEEINCSIENRRWESGACWPHGSPGHKPPAPEAVPPRGEHAADEPSNRCQRLSLWVV